MEYAISRATCDSFLPLGTLSEAAAAGLVAGGVISVLLFPALALGLLRKEPA